MLSLVREYANIASKMSTSDAKHDSSPQASNADCADHNQSAPDGKAPLNAMDDPQRQTGGVSFAIPPNVLFIDICCLSASATPSKRENKANINLPTTQPQSIAGADVLRSA